MEIASNLYDVLMENYLLLIESDRQFFARFKLSQVRYFALLHIAQHPTISLTELSKRLICTKGNTTRIIQSMVNDGFLTRTKDQTDQRALQLELTTSGWDLFHQVQQEFEILNQQRFKGMTVDAPELIQILSVLKTDLERSLKPSNKT